MMLRSSSTPILGSLISSSESPNNNNNNHLHNKSSPIHKFSLHHQTPSPGSQQHFTTLSCNSSPISPSFRTNGIRRAQSEGNLDSLITCSVNTNANDDDFSFLNVPKKHSTRIHTCFLETIPSFSYQNSRFKSEDGESSDHEHEEFDKDDQGFSGFDIENKVLSLNKQLGFANLAINDDLGGGDSGSSPMYLAKGIGVDTGFGCGGGDIGPGGGGRNLSHIGDGGGDNNHDTEERYKKMVNENPGNPLFLRNYAQFLYQSKQDLQGAEEYYSRAILVDPNDGEILSQYAKILWELHHDKDRATNYFERAVQAASEDSHVHAAYASFLWEIEGGEDEEEEVGYYNNIPLMFNNGTMASAATA
uniref:uncharacterized protein LOC122594244 n=1 Tax=Erigeron canadensis TaxID=72917 RepID=UPI001CB90411|nr:uncharacterized protein LOC122594244 [Erigeron canadensis]